MKWLCKEFEKCLPRYNYNYVPVLYIRNKTSLRYAYTFDRKKEVLLTSDSEMEDFRYMSIYEFVHENWEIISKKELYKVYNISFHYDELPL